MVESQRKATFVMPHDGAHLSWFGERLRYLLVGEQTGGRFALSSRTVPVGDRVAPFIHHRGHVGYFVLSGELNFTVGNRTLSLSAGGFLGVAPGTAQSFANSAQAPVELLTITGPAGLDEFHFRSGVPLPRAEATAPTLTGDDHDAREALAPGYGIDLKPPAESLRCDPKMRLTFPGEGGVRAVLGDLYRFLATSEDTAGRYAVIHVTAAPGGGPPWHTHSREDEVFHVLHGTVAFEIEGTTVELGPGGVVHLPCGVRHRFENRTTEPAEMLILAAPAGLEKLFETVGRDWHDPATLPPPPDTAEIERLVQEAPRYGVELFH